jgi:hypothetical protein
MYLLNWKGYITKVENIVTDQLSMINETIMAYFMLLSQHLPSGTEQSQPLGQKLNLRSRIWNMNANRNSLYFSRIDAKNNGADTMTLCATSQYATYSDEDNDLHDANCIYYKFTSLALYLWNWYVDSSQEPESCFWWQLWWSWLTLLTPYAVVAVFCFAPQLP